MARLIAVLYLVTILIAQSGGSYLFISGLQHQLKKQAHDKISEGLTNEQLVVIKANEATSLIWTEDDEFQWQGIMFDIVYTEVHDGIIWYYCYQDENETKLLALWENYLQSQPVEEDMGFISSMGWVFGSYINSNVLSTNDISSIDITFLYPKLICQVIQMTYQPDTPPPQFG